MDYLNELAPADEIAYQTIKANLKKTTGLDLKGYKDNYIKRRMSGRLSSSKAQNYTEYLMFLNKNPEEYAELKNFITINVTKFFRDKNTYDFVMNIVLPGIIAEKEKAPVKKLAIWSAGCSIGEEPYSISIMLHEILGTRIREFSPTIHATDVDDEAIRDAKIGEYDKEAFSETDPVLAQKYFALNPATKRYAVKPEIKSIVDFKHQDMIHERPLPNMDLIFCRNVLIYFSEETHQLVFRNFHESLRPGGYLVIGGSESIHGEMAAKFETVNMYAHTFRKPAAK